MKTRNGGHIDPPTPSPNQQFFPFSALHATSSLPAKMSLALTDIVISPLLLFPAKRRDVKKTTVSGILKPASHAFPT